jgi:hypothetical protein
MTNRRVTGTMATRRQRLPLPWVRCANQPRLRSLGIDGMDHRMIAIAIV